MTAKEARSLTNQAQSLSDIDAIISGIREAAKAGYNEYCPKCNLTDGQRKRLRELGYSVGTIPEPMPIGNLRVDYIIISW